MIKNKRKFKKVNTALAMMAISALCGSFIFGSTLTAQAASLADYFNAKEYAENYPDLKAAFGENTAPLLEHYLTFGVAEGRESSLKDLIDLKKYREANADLDAAFGDSWQAYLDHYLTYGAKEGRSSFGTFDAIAYANRYPDLKAAYGDDISGLFQHWVTFGKEEGRVASTYEQVYENNGSSQADPGAGGNEGDDNTGGEPDVNPDKPDVNPDKPDVNPDKPDQPEDRPVYEAGGVKISVTAADTWTIAWDCSSKLKDMEENSRKYPGWNLNGQGSRGFGVHFLKDGQDYMLEVMEDLNSNAVYINTPQHHFFGENTDLKADELWGTGIKTKYNDNKNWEGAEIVSVSREGNIVEWTLQFNEGYVMDLSEISDIHGFVFFIGGQA